MMASHCILLLCDLGTQWGLSVMDLLENTCCALQQFHRQWQLFYPLMPYLVSVRLFTKLLLNSSPFSSWYPRGEGSHLNRPDIPLT